MREGKQTESFSEKGKTYRPTDRLANRLGKDKDRLSERRKVQTETPLKTKKQK